MRAEVGERGTSETSPKPFRRREGHQAAFNGLEGYYREHVKGSPRNERDPGLTRNRFKSNDLRKKVRF